MRRLIAVLLPIWLLLLAQPAAAAVTMTFWSHDQDQEFPHAFFTLKGTRDADGVALDANYGFTAKSLTPAILWGSVGGMIQTSSRNYMKRSDAQFSTVLTDAQLADVLALVAEWRVHTKYNLNKRNCVHFIAEALRRSGLIVPDLPQLMKKPKSFLIAVGQANDGRVVQIRLNGGDYFARFGPAAVEGAAAVRLPEPAKERP